MKVSKLKNVWYKMRNACYNRFCTAWYHCGAIGLEVCPQWRYDFQQFVKDMGEPPDIPGVSFMRLDPKKGYEPSNCKWVTKEEARALRDSRCNRVLVHGKPMLVREAAAKLGIAKSAVRKRAEARNGGEITTALKQGGNGNNQYKNDKRIR